MSQWILNLHHIMTALFDTPALSSASSVWINSVSFQFNFHSALIWPVLIKLGFCGGSMCFTSESHLSADTVRQLQTDSLQSGLDGTKGLILSWDRMCKCNNVPMKCIACVCMCAVFIHTSVWLCDRFSLGHLYAFIDIYEHVGSYVCVCARMCLFVCMWWRGPWSSVLCSQRSAWLPSLYEPSVQSDRNKKPYSALGIGKTGWGFESKDTHTHAHTYICRIKW